MLEKFPCYVDKLCDPLKQYDAQNGLWLSIGLIWAVGVGFYALSLAALWIRSKRY